MNAPEVAVSPRWQEKFALLEKQWGGPINDSMKFALAAKGPNGQKLSVGEMFTLMCWPAFFFGIFWYLFKGMWKKALTIFGAALVLFIPLSFLPPFVQFPVQLVVAFLIAKLATGDYYRLVKEGHNDWM
ncbi:MAG: hypothetical protein RLZZ618_116 [Pseudomonadota bacterium]|jgi:hypothetical protein